MSEQFNIFTEVSPRHLLAYIDCLAQNCATQDLSATIQDPFSQKIDFLKQELAASKAVNEMLQKRLNEQALSSKMAQAVLETRQDLEFGRQSLSQSKDNLVAVIGDLNHKITWLMGKFYLSMHFPLFLGKNILRRANPATAKEEAWFMYFATINIASMSEIIDTCKHGNQQISTLAPEVQSFFNILKKIDKYFHLVIQCLNSIGKVKTESLDHEDLFTVPDRQINKLEEVERMERLLIAHGSAPSPINKIGVEKVSDGGLYSEPEDRTVDVVDYSNGICQFISLLKSCHNEAIQLENIIRNRNNIFEQLFAIVYTSFPEPDYQRTAKLFQPKGALGRYIQTSKI